MANTLIIPTGPNIINYVAAKLNAASRSGAEAQIVLPSLRKRAYMICNESGVLAVKDVAVPVAQNTVRGS